MAVPNYGHLHTVGVGTSAKNDFCTLVRSMTDDALQSIDIPSAGLLMTEIRDNANFFTQAERDSFEKNIMKGALKNTHKNAGPVRQLVGGSCRNRGAVGRMAQPWTNMETLMGESLVREDVGGSYVRVYVCVRDQQMLWRGFLEGVRS